MNKGPTVDVNEEAKTQAKRRKVDNNDLSFKTKVKIMLKRLSVAAPVPLAVAGKVNAPLINIAIKNSTKIIHFPLHESKTVEVIQLIEQSPHGNVQRRLGNTASWELNSGGFEILKLVWHDFVNRQVAAKINQKMCIEISFTPSLNKMLINQAGSYLCVHDSRWTDGSFATLIVQLPSKYKGGPIVFRHNNGKTVTTDYCPIYNCNTSDTFFTAFYDCSFNTKRAYSTVTEGYQVCLVYNLIARKPAVPRRLENELKLGDLMNNWTHRVKLVYTLKHEYSESDLSFDNLKTTDRSIVNLLVYIAKENDLNVCLAILNKVNSGQSIAPGSHLDSDALCSKCYNLSKLIASDGTLLLTTSLTVNFDAEVIPEDCFENRKNITPSSNVGMDVTNIHSSAAIVFWPKRFLLAVPKKCGASSADLDKIFLKEIQKYRGNVHDDTVKTRLNNWAKEVIAAGGNKSIDVIKAIVEMKNIPLIQSLFSSGVISNHDSVSLVIDVCETYGWGNFAGQVPEMFRQLRKEDAFELLGRIGTAAMDKGKKTVVQQLMEIIFNKLYFSPTMTQQDRLTEEELLLSACRFAEKMNINMVDILKGKSMFSIVPVLLRLVPGNTNKLAPIWKDVAQHFVQEMETEASKPVHTWHRDDELNFPCECKDCPILSAYFKTDQDRICFLVGQERRQHQHLQLIGKDNIWYQDYAGEYSGSILIEKTDQGRVEGTEKRTFSITNLEKLRAIVPN